MDGVHDLGGFDGFGPVDAHGPEPVFADEWEGRLLAIVRSMGYAGAWQLDHLRSAVEQLPPVVYLASAYYERWLLAIEHLVVTRGLASRTELTAGQVFGPGPELSRRLTVEVANGRLARGSFFGTGTAEPRFAIGQQVRTQNLHPRGHIRLPGYARDKVGTVERCHGCHTFPDAVAADRGDDPQWLYTVAFDAAELWGPDAEADATVSFEAYEPYLEPA
jgi:nitrile hydratase